MVFVYLAFLLCYFVNFFGFKYIWIHKYWYYNTNMRFGNINVYFKLSSTLISLVVIALVELSFLYNLKINFAYYIIYFLYKWLYVCLQFYFAYIILFVFISLSLLDSFVFFLHSQEHYYLNFIHQITCFLLPRLLIFTSLLISIL